MTTVRDKVREIRSKDMFGNEWEKQLWLAYMMGREDATVEVSDRYRDWIRQMREKADKLRYSKMVNRIIDNDNGSHFDGKNYLYIPDYSKCVSHELADDEYVEPKDM